MMKRMQDGWTNLHYAAAGGNADQVCSLIAASADIEAKNQVCTVRPALLSKASQHSSPELASLDRFSQNLNKARYHRDHWPH